MLSYELCKRLKDAGFPQGKSDYIYSPYWTMGSNMEKPKPILHNREKIIFSDYFDTGDEEVDCPTLSELIDACGEMFGYLNKDKVVCWTASTSTPTFNSEIAVITCDGDTPEEAVANLWLKLNKKV